MNRQINLPRDTNTFDFTPKRILFGKNEAERKKYFKKQFTLLIENWNQIPWRQWGVGSAKSIGNFLREIGDGEVVLSIKKGQLIRNLEFVVVFLFEANGRWLVEEIQRMSDGRVRNRRFPYISERLKLGENSIDTAIRAINEETGGYIVAKKSKLVKGDIYILDENHAYNTGSTSYPGIKSIKKLYTFSYFVSKDEFKPKYTEVDTDGSVTVHSWKKVTENVWFSRTKLEEIFVKNFKISKRKK